MRGIVANGGAIVAARRAAGLTQEQLASAADCDVKTVRKAEQGRERVDLRVVVSITKTLNCDVDSLIVSEDSNIDKRAQNIQLVEHWHAAFLAGDLDLLMSLHTDDTILEIPGADDLPGAGTYYGIDALREHLQEISQTFRLESVEAGTFQIRAADDIVYHRCVATFMFLPANKKYTTFHINEFEIRDGKIARRTVVADYDKLREILREMPQ